MFYPVAFGPLQSKKKKNEIEGENNNRVKKNMEILKINFLIL